MEEIPQPPNRQHDEENSHYSTLNEEQQMDLPQISSQLQEMQSDPNHKIFPQYNSSMTIPLHLVKSFDSILIDLDFGLYQTLAYMVTIIFGITEGAQVTIFTLMIPILQNEWGISVQLTSLQTSFVFVGFLIGSLLSGYFTDHFGRRKPFILSAFFTIVVCLASTLSTEIYSLLVLRGLLGIFVGFFAPCCVTMLQEITPLHLRGRFMSAVTLSVAIGQLYGLLIAGIVLNNLQEGNWQKMTLYGTLPGVLSLIGSFLIVDESARFELLQGRHEKAFIIMEKIKLRNKSNVILDDETKYMLINWAHTMNRHQKISKKAPIAALFVGQRLQMTLILWITWFSLCFMYYGNIMMMPYLLEVISPNESAYDQIFYLVLSCISDMVAAVIASYFIETKGFGRKNSMIIFFFCSAIFAFVTYFDGVSHFIYWSTIQKFFLSMGFIFCFQLSAEVYPTKVRATGLGFSIAMGRFGGIAMPWICTYLSSIQLLSPYLLFGIVSLASSVINVFIPFETLGRELDT